MTFVLRREYPNNSKPPELLNINGVVERKNRKLIEVAKKYVKRIKTSDILLG